VLTPALTGDPEFENVKVQLMKLLEQTVNGYARSAGQDSTGGNQEVDEATEKALRSLGYIR
jgi:hypothetical protein